MQQWAGCLIRRLPTVDSTNREARRWTAEGAPHGAVVIAEDQTDGRGRRGRGWESTPGAGLWFSMVLRPDIPPESYAMLPLLAALAASDACAEVSPVRPAIKWPNDLIATGRKLVGILVEREGDAAVMGIGINVRQREMDFPEPLRGKAISLEMLTDAPVSIDALAHALMRQIERRMDRFDFLAEYSARCITVGSDVRVLEAGGAFCGRAEAIDAQGALLVRDAEGTLRRVLAGDVSVRGVMGYA